MSDETASQPRIKTAWLIGVALAFAIFVLIASYSVRMTNDYTDYDAQRAQVRYETLKKVQAVEGALINPVDAKGNSTAEWVDQAKGTVRIPIEEAMAKEVDDLKMRPAAMGVALAPPAPAAPAASSSAPAATPAAKTNAVPASAPSTNAPAAAKPKQEKK